MNSQISMINVESIVPNRFQPRKTFDQAALQELANSIKEHGMIQPMVLRKLGDKFEIIAGERRYKAAIMNGMVNVPAIVMNLDDATSAEVALIENVQRKDLTPIEEAHSYKQILDLGQITQNEMAKKMGRNQSTISNKLRLLNLSDEVQQALLENKISERHARSLLGVKDKEKQIELLKKIMENRMTVRETDEEIKKINFSNNDEILDFSDDSQEEVLDFDSDSNENTKITKNELETNQVIPDEYKKEEIPVIEKQRERFFTMQREEPKVNNNYNQYQPQQMQGNYQPMPPQYDPNMYGQQQNVPTPETPQQSNYNQYQGGQFQPQQMQGNYQPMPPQYDPNMYGQQQNIPTPEAPQQNNYSPYQGGQFQPQQMQGNYQPMPPQYDPNMYSQQQNVPTPETPQQNVPQQPELPQYGDGNMGVNTEETSPQSIITQQDITGAVSVIRNTIMNLQNNGYQLDAEEFDLDNLHQIVIKIQK